MEEILVPSIFDVIYRLSKFQVNWLMIGYFTTLEFDLVLEFSNLKLDRNKNKKSEVVFAVPQKNVSEKMLISFTRHPHFFQLRDIFLDQNFA